MIAFFEELAEARSTYLFLPVVSRIDAHQGSGDALPLGTLRLDGLTDRWAASGVACLTSGAFVMTPGSECEHDAFLLAIATSSWGKGARRMDNAALLTEVAAQLRRLHALPRQALASVWKDVSNSGPDDARARELVEEVSERAT